MWEYPTSLSLDLSHMDPGIGLEVEEGWQQPTFRTQLLKEREDQQAAELHRHCPLSAVSNWAVIMPFGAETENLDEFSPCSEPTRIYIGQK